MRRRVVRCRPCGSRFRAGGDVDDAGAAGVDSAGIDALAVCPRIQPQYGGAEIGFDFAFAFGQGDAAGRPQLPRRLPVVQCGGGDGGIPMGGLVKLGGAGNGGEVGMRFGEFRKFVGGGLQVARIEGQVGLVMQFFVLAVVFSEHVLYRVRVGWKRRFAALLCICIGAVRCFQTANTADRSFFRATWRLGSARPGL